MKTHSTNYYDTFIAIADDSKANKGEVPADKGHNKTAAGLQFEMISKHPYQYTSDDVIFAAYAHRHDLTENELNETRKQFFAKGQACLRASALGKRYGWGVHSNADGKIALYGCDTPEYRDYLNQKGIKVVKAMRSKR
jgi:hypothetical protein